MGIIEIIENNIIVIYEIKSFYITLAAKNTTVLPLSGLCTIKDLFFMFISSI
jgi:hypothetical protein